MPREVLVTEPACLLVDGKLENSIVYFVCIKLNTA
jgi:hypothetical protein